MALTSLTGKPTHYPKLADLEIGTVIFERATLVKAEPGFKFPEQTNWIFEIDEPITTEKGDFTRVGISSGMITKALRDEPMGGDYRLVYLGKNVIEKGKWAGTGAHTFDLQKYVDDEGVDVNKVAAAQARVNESKSNAESKGESNDSLDDMMA